MTVDTEAVQTRVLLLTPVGEDVELHSLVHLLSGILQDEGLRWLSKLVVGEVSQEGFRLPLELDPLQGNQSPIRSQIPAGSLTPTLERNTHVDFEISGGRPDLAGGGVGALGVLQRHLRDSDGVRQRDGHRPLGAHERPTFTGVPEGTLGGERGGGGGAWPSGRNLRHNRTEAG